MSALDRVVLLRTSQLICWLTLATVSVGAIGMNAQDSQREMERFGRGQRLGDCLVKGCVVFIGVVESIGPAEKEPGEPDPERAMMTRRVNLRITQRLHGEQDGDSVELRSATRPQFSKAGLGPWQAWASATLDVGAELLVVRWAKDAPRPTWRGTPEDVAIAVSEKTLFAPIRDAIDQHHRFERDPAEVARIPQLLHDKQDVLFKGYLLTYLMDREGVRNVDNAAAILSKLIGYDPVPGAGRAAIAEWLGGTFYRLGEATRRASTEMLVASASADDANVANPALTVLVKLGDLQMLEMKPYLTPARQPKILENYRRLQAQNKVQPRHPEFESQLGIR